MKLPGGTVYEVEHVLPVVEVNRALDGHGMVYGILNQMVEVFMEGLPREKDAK